MKRGTLDHPKLRRLARLLEVEPWGAAGILESLWHWTARYARRGDVGRYRDEEIAEGIGWVARPARELIEALVLAGWLDPCADHRLVIHDVADHADHAWRESMRGPEGSAGFLKACTPCAEAAQALRASSALPVPVPVPVPVPEPDKEKLAIARQKKVLPRAERAQRATTWPENFRMTEAHVAQARRLGVEMPWEWEKFRDHHQAKGSRFTNWDAAWRTWLRNAVDFDLRRRV